ncbi:MAG: hypothetical protein KKA62_02925 [Nanoarchaeota archaeon]|nr:hypothetical protein [Nanoarchaeota archaeon]MBU1976884.1 hypothetical protein [Nanoarchaeota archaeon]
MYIRCKEERVPTIEFTSDVGYNCGCSSENITFILKGDIGPGCGNHSKNCTFKFTKVETLEKLIKFSTRMTLNENSGNRVFLITVGKEKRIYF